AQHWARPGSPDARFYLTANAAFWLAVAAADAGAEPSPALLRGARAILDQIDESGTWPGFLVSGWLAAAVLHRTESLYQAARNFLVLGERAKTLTAADADSMRTGVLRVSVSAADPA